MSASASQRAALSAAARSPRLAAARTRVHDWPQRLADRVEQMRYEPFRWGTHDCCTFAAGWVCEATGYHALTAYAPWRDAQGATRTVLAAGGLPAIVTRHLGEPIAPSLAARGDIVLVQLDGRDSLAVVLGSVAAAPGLEGLAFLPLVTWRQGWRV